LRSQKNKPADFLSPRFSQYFFLDHVNRWFGTSNKLYGIERDSKDASDEKRFIARQEKSLPTLAQLKS
jgi:hypothetical protein